jgi:hypothetical protein
MRNRILRIWAGRSWRPVLIAGGAALALSLTFAYGTVLGQFPQQPTTQYPPGSDRLPAMTRPPEPTPNIGIGPGLSRRQKDALVNDNFKKTKADVAKLSKLVHSLQQQLSKSNANILSLSIVKQAGKIEKLAKKIRNEAKAY